MNVAALLLLLLSSAKPHDTVESVRQQYVQEFKADLPGKVEIFYAPCIARPQCPDEEVYTLGIMQAATDTGHPVLWRTSGSSEDEPKYALEKK
jgi:hypothetical protein